MIGHALRVEIELFAAKRCRENALFQMAEAGEVDEACLRAYLTSIHYLVQNTPICLRRARDRARSLGDKALAAHYESKIIEETGHDEWAVSDLASVGQTVASASSAVPTINVVPTMRALVDFIVKTIDEDPSLYLAYILFAEHLTVVVGPEWLQLLSERCGFPSSSVSVITNHVELDKEHVEEALDSIDDLVGEPRKLPRMREILRSSIDHFESFCTELAENHQKRIASDASEPRQKQGDVHVPAA